MIHSISILGSTGSIGKQSLSVAAHLGISVSAIAANHNIDLLEQQARQYSPRLVAVYDPVAAKQLRTSLADTDITVVSGMDGLIDAATFPDSDCVVTAVSGSVGLRPTLAAIDAGKRIALANKETLVCAGDLVMQRILRNKVELIPVDSEHSAIFQSLGSVLRNSALKRILLTASGGPFRGMTKEETYGKTPAQALRHPNWSMGAKITVDSATMMNKGLELIEAMHLFGVTPNQIQILIHPQSVLHSAVEYCDGSVVGQMAVPNMELPIQYAMTYPERVPSLCSDLNLFTAGSLTFEEPDLENLPCLAMAIQSANRKGTAPCILSAANEEAVGLFLQEKICFGEIAEKVSRALDDVKVIDAPSLDEILEADAAARVSVKR